MVFARPSLFTPQKSRTLLLTMRNSRSSSVTGIMILPRRSTRSSCTSTTQRVLSRFLVRHRICCIRAAKDPNECGMSPPDQALIYVAQNGSYLPSNNAVAYNENATIPFEAGKTYRLRIINTSSFAMFFAWLDGHDMRVIEVDGVRRSRLLVAVTGISATVHSRSPPQLTPLPALSADRRRGVPCRLCHSLRGAALLSSRDR